MHLALLRQRPAGAGGAETTLGHLARGLAAAGHTVTVYGAPAGAAAQRRLGPQVRFVPVPLWGGKTGRLLSYALHTRRLLHAAKPDLVFSLERTLRQDVYRAGDGCHREWLARRTPFLSLPARLAQSLSPFHRVMLWLEGRLFASPELKRVIANSRMVKAEIIRHYGVDPEAVRVVLNGLDHQVFHPVGRAERQALRQRLEAPEGAGVILFVGSGFARKGLAYLLEAFSRLTHEHPELWVVGKGRVGPYENLARRLGITGRVTFWGSQSEVASFYRVAAVLALPTLYDPCSNVVLEALGCGCPVVTTTANGAAEFITPGENGQVLRRPDDAPAWAEALAEWLDRGTDPRVQQAAREAVAHLTWDKTVAQTLEIIREAAGR